MTVAWVDLLAMNAAPTVATAAASVGRRASILESAPRVDIGYEDLSERSDWRDGLQLIGTPEPKLRRVFTLRFPICPEPAQMFIRQHYNDQISAGNVPFQWVRPGEGEAVSVQYAAPPQINPRTPQGGAATVVLHEVFLTD